MSSQTSFNRVKMPSVSAIRCMQIWSTILATLKSYVLPNLASNDSSFEYLLSLIILRYYWRFL